MSGLCSGFGMSYSVACQDWLQLSCWYIYISREPSPIAPMLVHIQITRSFPYSHCFPYYPCLTLHIGPNPYPLPYP